MTTNESRNEIFPLSQKIDNHFTKLEKKNDIVKLAVPNLIQNKAKYSSYTLNDLNKKHLVPDIFTIENNINYVIRRIIIPVQFETKLFGLSPVNYNNEIKHFKYLFSSSYNSKKLKLDFFLGEKHKEKKITDKQFKEQLSNVLNHIEKTLNEMETFINNKTKNVK